jgi:hypothetical protein
MVETSSLDDKLSVSETPKQRIFLVHISGLNDEKAHQADQRHVEHA